MSGIASIARRSLRCVCCWSLSASLTLGAPAFAQAAGFAAPATPTETSPNRSDEVLLESGGFVVGEVTEYIPGEYVVIIPRGSTVPKRFEWSEVSSVTRDSAPSSAGELEPEPAPPPDSSALAAPATVPGGVVAEPTSESESESEAEGTHVSVSLPPTAKTPIYLYRVEGEAYGSSAAGTIHALAYSEVCESPCFGTLSDTRGEFFVGGGKYQGSKRFRLMGNAPGYDIKVTPKPKWYRYLGYGLAVGSALVTGLMLIAPFEVSMPKSAAKGWYAGAGILGGGMLIGGLTLSFSRSKVEVERKFR